ncbi:hypothetical protein [Paraburkholderia sp. 40]|uniref:hypothetical protein n=1 Tax=unclassified Paraburkholderia TaxID=2615204 RepID=UPI003D1D8F39
MNHFAVLARLQIEYAHGLMNSRVAAELIFNARNYGESRNKSFGGTLAVGLPLQVLNSAREHYIAHPACTGKIILLACLGYSAPQNLGRFSIRETTETGSPSCGFASGIIMAVNMTLKAGDRPTLFRRYPNVYAMPLFSLRTSGPSGCVSSEIQGR